MLRAFLIAVSAISLGLLGASAFNPDDGFLLQSELLWRIFGLAAYFGLFVVYGIPVFLAMRFVARGLRRACHRGVTSHP
jgi:hypothetical protein